MEDKIKEFLNKTDYDIRKTHNARWIDQKCTMDVLSVIAECIIKYIDNDLEKEFTKNDIWHSEYSRNNILEIFNKPDPKYNAQNEYDKVFAQPLKLLGYSKVLIEEKRNNKNYYKVNNLEILEYISSRDRFANTFLVMYITKVLKDSNIYSYFEEFFNKQNKEYYEYLKNAFYNFTKNNTPINENLECGRMFTKVLNPLAFNKKKLGTYRGRISKNIITLDMLMYNRPNWRDIYTKKPKDITRSEYEKIYENMLNDKMTSYKINKAKKLVKEYNFKYNNGKSELYNAKYPLEKATQMHHIFMASEFPNISDYTENLISLTPTEHYNYAHNNGNTNSINYNFQKECLISKIIKIKECLEDSKKDKIYSFDDMLYVLNTGFETDIFDYIEDMNFDKVLKNIDYITNNKNIVAESNEKNSYNCN